MDELVDTIPAGCADWVVDALDGPGWDDFVGEQSGWDVTEWDESAADRPACTPGDRFDDALDELIRLDVRRAQLTAQEMELLVRVAGMAEQRREVVVADLATDSERTLVIADEAREEVSAALRRPAATVHSQLVAARLLFGPLRRTLAALAAGVITEAHARVIADEAEILHRSLAGDQAEFTAACISLEDRVLLRAESCTRPQLRRLAKAAVAAIDSEGEQDRRRDARRAIDVRVQVDGHGLSVLTACLPTVDAERIRMALDEHARSDSVTTPCDATLGQRRAAALVDLVCGSTGDGAGRDRTNGLPRVPVGAEISIVMTLDEFVRGDGVVGGLLEDPRLPLSLRRLITDPRTGRALDLGRRRYVVSESLRRWIIARDRTCRFPECSRRAAACQIDHVEAWGDEGCTDAANLQALCTRHHQLKTHGGWRVSREDATGLTVWTSPSGRTYWVDPEHVVPPGPPPPGSPPGGHLVLSPRREPDPPPF